MYALPSINGTPTAPSSFGNPQTFGPSSLQIVPLPAIYSNGYLPGQGFPAENENWLMYNITNSINQITYDLYNIHSEILSVLSGQSISPDGTTGQLNTAIGSKITTTVTASYMAGLFAAYGGNVGIGKSPAFTLDVNGTINGVTDVKINGVSLSGVAGKTATNASGTNNVPLNNGTLNVNLNSDLLDGMNTGQSGVSYIPYADSVGTVFLQSNTIQQILTIGGAFTSPPSFSGRRSTGTVASPAQLGSGVNVFIINAQGYGNTAFKAVAQISFGTEETITDTAAGGNIKLNTTTIGTTTIAERARINSSGQFLIGLTSNLGSGANLQVVSPTNSGLLQINGNTNGTLPNQTTSIGLTILANYQTSLGDVSYVNDYFIATVNSVWYQRTSATTVSRLMQLNSTGNLGIGDFSPTSYHLDVQSTLDRQFNVTGKGGGWSGTTLVNISTESAGSFTGDLLKISTAFYTDIFHVRGDNKVLINRSTDDGSGALLQVNGSISATNVGTKFSVFNNTTAVPGTNSIRQIDLIDVNETRTLWFSKTLSGSLVVRMPSSGVYNVMVYVADPLSASSTNQNAGGISIPASNDLPAVTNPANAVFTVIYTRTS